MSSTTIGLGVPFPKMLPIVGTWALPLAIYQLILSARVSMIRVKSDTMIGEHSKEVEYLGYDPLTIASRSHANFTENVPFALLLAAIAELNGANKKRLHYTLAALFISRIMHVELGLRASDDARAFGRPIGNLITQSTMVGLATYTLYLVKGYWGY